MLAEALATTVVGAGGLLAWGVRGRSSTLLAPSVWQGSPSRRAIALTFDDGPSESTPVVLDLLDRHHVRATFFQIGANARRLPSIAQQVVAAGHEIGNHTENHFALYLKSPDFIEGELTAAQESLQRATGVKPIWFRAPYGCRWFGLARAQSRLGLMGVMWSGIARDWALNADGVASRLRSASRPGAILCLHDGRVRQIVPDTNATVKALSELLPWWRDQGYAMLSLNEFLCLQTPQAA